MIDRRKFLRGAAMYGGAAVLSNRLRGAGADRAREWMIGCFNRPWYPWSFDDALGAIRAAGFHYFGMLGGHKGDPLIGPDSKPEYLVKLKARIAASGLQPLAGAFRVDNAKPTNVAIAVARERIENAHALGLPYLLTADEPKPEYYARNIEVMAASAEFAQQKGIKLVFKPHGSDAPALLRLLRDVGHPNFKIWYDAGNILYYTGRNPLENLDPLLEHITGFCAKDCTGPKGEVMIQFGAGKVDFAALMARLQSAGFSGPILVECCAAGDSAAAAARNAAANRVFLERLLARR